MKTARRAVVVCRVDCDRGAIERLSQIYGLRVVYTVYTDTGPELASRIAVPHALEHDAEVVMVPHLSEQEVREAWAWQTVTWLVDVVTVTGVVDRGSRHGNSQ